MESFVTNRLDMRRIDREAGGIRNKFNLHWLSEKDENGDLFGDYIRKVYQPGHAFCVYCSDTLNYGSTGIIALKSHAARAKHKSNRPSKDKSATEDSTRTPTTSTGHSTNCDISSNSMSDDTQRPSTSQDSPCKETVALSGSTSVNNTTASESGNCNTSAIGKQSVNTAISNSGCQVTVQVTTSSIVPPSSQSTTSSSGSSVATASHSVNTISRKGLRLWQEQFLTDRVEIKTVDAGVRNPFRMQWLSLVDVHGDMLKEYIRKPKVPGEAICSYCQAIITYGASGKACFTGHAASLKHAENRNEALKEKAAGVSKADNIDSVYIDHTYGSSGQGPTEGTSTSGADNIQDPTQFREFLSLFHHKKQRKREKKTMRALDLKETVVAFIVEHGLSMSMLPHLVGLAKELGRDDQALRDMKMFSKTLSQNKLINKIAEPFRTQMVQDLQKCRFSLCVGASPYTGTTRMMKVLVSYYSEGHGKVVLQHYLSNELPLPDAESIHATLVKALQKDSIPLSNLVSVLIDPTAYVNEGVRKGFDNLTQLDAPHLLRISDTCYVVDGIVRKFCSHFSQYLEGLVQDICTDLAVTPDLLNKLKDICRIKDIEFKEPLQMAPCEYLSIYDSIIPIVHMRTALTLLYMAWVSEGEASKELRKLLIDLMPDTNKGKKLVLDVRDQCRQLKLTPESLARKRRIVTKLIANRMKTLLLMNMYNACLKKFKDYSLFCRSRQPVVHQLYKKQKELMLWFLQGFIKPEALKKCGSDLQIFDIRDKSLHLPDEQLYMGFLAREMLRSLEDSDKVRQEYLQNLKVAYLETAEILQSCLYGPHVIQQMASLDPIAHGTADTWLIWSEMRTEHFSGILNDEEVEEFEREVRMFQVEGNVPKLEEDMRVDEWWRETFKATRNYPNLEKIVKACLSVLITAPVETSSTLSRNPPELVPVMQTVKYHYQCKEMTKYEKRKELLALAAHEPVGDGSVPPQEDNPKGEKKQKDSGHGKGSKKKKRKRKEQPGDGSQSPKKKKTDSVGISPDEDAVVITPEQSSEKSTSETLLDLSSENTASITPLELSSGNAASVNAIDSPSIIEDMVTIKEEVVESEESISPVELSAENTASINPVELPSVTEDIVTIKEEVVESEELTLSTVDSIQVSDSHNSTSITQYDSVPPTDHGLLLEVAIKDEPPY